MAKFVAVHTIKVPVTGDDIVPIANGVKVNNTINAYWVSSWLQLN